MLDDKTHCNFSFSGLKTAVRYRIAGTGKQSWGKSDLEPQLRADIAASFQQAILDCLIGKSLQAVKITGTNRLCVGGGVASNRAFRTQLAKACEKAQIDLHIAAPELCTDNAVMGALAWEKIKRGQFDSLDLDAQPGLLRRK
jgi:N6-L-threonylcarbamoyladenine synthase